MTLKPYDSWFKCGLILIGVGLVSLLTVGGSSNPAEAVNNGAIPLQSPYLLPASPETYLSNMMSGGPPKDGIPSIDDPKFISARKASNRFLDPGDIIIGYAKSGEAKAYPQKILVQHEIVNDVFNGDNVAITYCPLTATAQGFKRGATTLGVSGRLINSNLVMYDRATDSFYPQILATGIKGKNKGKSLQEFNVVWTTWERWKEKYPSTTVLSTKTGYLRSYDRDPYGSYNPRGGYYSSPRTMFPLMESPTKYSAKTMVLGARTGDKSVYVPMKKLRDNRILRTTNFVIVYDGVLDTGYIYSKTDEKNQVKPVSENQYQFNGKNFNPSELPLTKHVSIEGFYFAWNAFYPNSETI